MTPIEQLKIPINLYSRYIKETYNERIQKIPIDAGFTCPNRDGNKGVGGCIYCSNNSFSFNTSKTELTDQITRGIAYYQKRYKNLKKFYIYFQSYSNTYAPIEELEKLYKNALSIDGVTGLCIGTRPDCVDKDKIALLDELGKNNDITIEYGIESIHDSTLKKINRCHDYQCFEDAVLMTSNKNIKICAHIILGFPWEDRTKMLASAKKLSNLPLDFLKIHQLHIVKNSIMATQYLKNEFELLSKEEYLDILCEYLSYLNPNIIIQRLFGNAPSEEMVSPRWDLTSSELLLELSKLMHKKNIYQGKYFLPNKINFKRTDISATL
jgi:uncharacterized protein